MRKFLVCLLTLLMLIQPGFTGFLPAPAALRAEEPSGGPGDPIPFVYGDENAASLAARESKYFTFTPDVTGTYVFSSSGATGAPEISLRKDEQGSYVIASDKNGRGNNFYLPVTLAAGELYSITLSAAAEARFSFSAFRTADDHANQSDLASPFSFESGAAGWLEYAGDVDAFTLTPLRAITATLSADTAAAYKLTVDGRDLGAPPYQITMYAGSSYDITITDTSNQADNFQPRPYTLRLDPLADAGSSEDAAEPLTANISQAGRIDYGGDRDCYSFISPMADGLYLLSVDGPADIRYDFTYTARAPLSAGDAELLEIGSDWPAYFYISGNAGSEYTVLLTPQPDDYMNLEVYYAAALAAGDEITGALEYEGDIDAFCFDITEPGYYSLTTTGLSEPQGVWFNDEQLPGAGFSERFLGSGTYYISVKAVGVTGAYTLTIQKEDLPLPPDPEGNTAAEAMPLPEPFSYSGALDYAGDRDWFVFTTGEQELYKVTLNGPYGAWLTIRTEDGRVHYDLREDKDILLAPNTVYYILADSYRYYTDSYSFSLTVVDYDAPVWEDAGGNALRFAGISGTGDEYAGFTAPVSGCYTFSLTGEGLTLSWPDLPVYYDDETELNYFLAQGQKTLLIVMNESSQPSPFTLTAEWIEDDYPGAENWWQAPLMDLDASYTMRCDFEYNFVYDSEDGLKLPSGLSGLYTFIAEGVYLIIAYEEDGQLDTFDIVEGYGSVSVDFQPDKQYYVAVFHEGEVGATVTLRALAGGDDYPNGIDDYIESQTLTMTAAGEIEYAGDADVLGFRPFFGPVRFSVSAERPLKAEIFTTGDYYATVRLAEASGTEIDFPYIFSPANPDLWQYQQGNYYLRLTATEAGETGIAYTITAAQLDDYGDDFADARAAELEQPLTGGIGFAGDMDVFRFTPLITAAYNFDFGSGGADLEWTLCDLTGAELLSGSGPGFARTLKAFAPYYLRLSGGSETDYALTVSYAPLDDYGNGPADAYALAEGALNGVIDYNNDLDYFSITPLETAHYSLSGSGLYALIAEITAADGAVISASTGEEFSVRTKFQGGQTYYFSLRAAYRDRLGSYSFTLTRLEDEA
ncbi:MAG: hypothetical protein LBL37_03100, partial [Gracilibacteraceae bacterium]|nr:hypothetical protein [Gracilibacteraceae bacterium]